MTTYTVGDRVDIIDDFNGHSRKVVGGTVKRLTKTQVVILNDLGNESKYRLDDNRMVGYAWPSCTHAIRKVD